MLRDDIAKWIVNNCHKTCGRDMQVESETALMEADEILSLINSVNTGSGVFVERECDCEKEGGKYCSTCADSNGMRIGIIRRELSNQEMLEWAKSIIRYNFHLDTLDTLLSKKWEQLKINNMQMEANEIACYMRLLCAGRYELALPTGERIVR